VVKCSDCGHLAVRHYETRHQQNLAVAVAGSKGNVWSNVIAAVIGAAATIATVFVCYWLANH
jgi:hypothetical protein